MVYERMAEIIKKNGHNIYLNKKIKRVITKENIAIGIELEDGEIKQYDHIISTMPLTLMVKNLNEVPENIKELTTKLKYRNTILVYLKVESEKILPDNWLYVHSPDLQMGRVTNFKNWVPQINNNEKTVFLF